MSRRISSSLHSLYRHSRLPLQHAPRRFNSSSAPLSIASSYTTPLAKQLTSAIKTTGPIPLAAYMRQCLTSETGGYYTTKAAEGKDQFGKAGDFITSPEISQMFGEMLGVWIVAEWMGQGRQKEGVQLVELGPGRGTLMDDVLRTLKSFPEVSGAVDQIYLIEASPTLRETQHRLLCSSPIEPFGSGFSATSKYGDITITWYNALSHVPPTTKPQMPFFLAHEFFDALPIHAFESTASGWRELLVSPVPPGSTHRTLKTPKSLTYSAIPEFALHRASNATPHSMLLPQLSERYKRLEKRKGSIIEICPEALTIMEEIAKRIGTARAGGALVMDYGPADTIPVNSLRGIQNHRTVSPFSSAGTVDLSADVDFLGLVERALAASDDVEVHGPVEQGAFLEMMGIEKRLQRLQKAEGADAEKQVAMLKAYERLVDRGVGGMGRVYKALSLVPERGGRRPVGFGGGLKATGEKLMRKL